MADPKVQISIEAVAKVDRALADVRSAFDSIKGSAKSTGESISSGFKGADFSALTDAFKTLRIKSTEQIEQEKSQIESAYRLISSSGKASAADIITAEKAKNAAITSLNNQNTNSIKGVIASASGIGGAFRSAIGPIVALSAAVTGLSSISEVFQRAIQSIDQFKMSVISVSALTYSQMNLTRDIATDWKRAKEYADGVATAMTEKVAPNTVLTGTQLRMMVQQLATAGVMIDATNQAQLDSMAALGNAIAVVTSGQNLEMQLNQEIRALMNGQAVAGSQLIRLLQAQDPLLKEHLATWKAENTILENIGKLLPGFNLASEDLKNTWTGVKMATESVLDSLLRSAFKDVYADMVSGLQDVVKWLRENKAEIASFMREVYTSAKGAFSTIVEVIKPLLPILKLVAEHIGSIVVAVTALGAAWAVMSGVSAMIGGVAAAASTLFTVLIEGALAGGIAFTGLGAAITTATVPIWAAVAALVAAWEIGKKIGAIVWDIDVDQGSLDKANAWIKDFQDAALSTKTKKILIDVGIDPEKTGAMKQFHEELKNGFIILDKASNSYVRVKHSILSFKEAQAAAAEESKKVMGIVEELSKTMDILTNAEKQVAENEYSDALRDITSRTQEMTLANKQGESTTLSLIDGINGLYTATTAAITPTVQLIEKRRQMTEANAEEAASLNSYIEKIKNIYNQRIQIENQLRVVITQSAQAYTEAEKKKAVASQYTKILSLQKASASEQLGIWKSYYDKWKSIHDNAINGMIAKQDELKAATQLIADALNDVTLSGLNGIEKYNAQVKLLEQEFVKIQQMPAGSEKDAAIEKSISTWKGLTAAITETNEVIEKVSKPMSAEEFMKSGASSIEEVKKTVTETKLSQQDAIRAATEGIKKLGDLLVESKKAQVEMFAEQKKTAEDVTKDAEAHMKELQASITQLETQIVNLQTKAAIDIKFNTVEAKALLGELSDMVDALTEKAQNIGKGTTKTEGKKSPVQDMERLALNLDLTKARKDLEGLNAEKQKLSSTVSLSVDTTKVQADLQAVKQTKDEIAKPVSIDISGGRGLENFKTEIIDGVKTISNTVKTGTEEITSSTVDGVTTFTNKTKAGTEEIIKTVVDGVTTFTNKVAESRDLKVDTEKAETDLLNTENVIDEVTRKAIAEKKLEVDTTQALTGLNALKSVLSEIKDKTITVTINTINTGSGSSEGSTPGPYAPNSTATDPAGNTWATDSSGYMIAPPDYAADGTILKAKPGGHLVIAAEAGKDEAFIPIDQRPSSLKLLFETAKRMGVGIRKFADGGIINGSVARLNEKFTVTSPQEVVRQQVSVRLEIPNLRELANTRVSNLGDRVSEINNRGGDTFNFTITPRFETGKRSPEQIARDIAIPLEAEMRRLTKVRGA